MRIFFACGRIIYTITRAGVILPPPTGRVVFVAQVTKWVANGVTLEWNPVTCDIRPDKEITYERVISSDGGSRSIRVVSGIGEESIDTFIDVSWVNLEAKWANWLYKLFENDTEIAITTHFEGSQYEDVENPGTMINDTTNTQWIVVIDEIHRQMVGVNRFDVAATLRKIGSIPVDEPIDGGPTP